MQEPTDYPAKPEQSFQGSLIFHKLFLHVSIEGEVGQALHGPAPSACVHLVIAQPPGDTQGSG